MASRRLRERIATAHWAAHAWCWPIDELHVLEWTMTERLDELIRRQEETAEAMREIEAGMTDRQLRRRYGALCARIGA